MDPDHITLPEALSATHLLHRTYWDTDQKRVKGVHAAKRDTPEVFDGPSWFFREDGTLWAERDYRDGRVWTAGYCLDGSGAKLDVGDLREGDGLLRVYHDNDQLASEGAYAGGRPVGTWRTFYSDGTLCREGDYVEGDKRGTWRHFSQGAKDPHRVEDHREDGSVYVTFWEGKRRQSEGLRRLDEDGRWVDDGAWKQFENGKHTSSTVYEMGARVGSFPNPEPVLRALAKHATPKDQLRAIKKAAKYTNIAEYLVPLHETGELSVEVAVSVALEGWSQLWSQTFPVVLSYGEAAIPTIDAVAKKLAKEDAPNSNSCALVCLWRWELGGEQPLPDDYGDLLFRALSANRELIDHQLPAIERLRALVASYPLELRQAVVTSQSSAQEWQRGRPLFAYAGLAPTEASIAAALEETLSLKKTVFQNNPTRSKTLARFFEEAGDLAVPQLVACMAAKGAKAPARQILLGALAKSGSAEAAAPLLAHADDKNDGAARAAREGLEALGEAALPALEAALGGRKKNLKRFAAEVLSRLDPTEPVRAVAERRLAKEKAKDIRALLEPIVSGAPDATETTAQIAAAPPMVQRIEAARAALDAEAILASLEIDKGWSVIERNTKKLLADTPDAAVVLIDRVNAAHRSEAEGIYGLNWEQIAWPLKSAGEAELGAWLCASVCATVQEKRPLNLKYVLPDMAGACGAELAPALSWFLSRGEPFPAKKPVLRWLAETAPAAAVPAFAAVADDRAKPVRKLATEGLIAAGEAAREVAHGLLGGSTREQSVAVDVLRARPSGASIAKLEAALAKEKNKKRREALESALMACRLATGDVDPATLDAALAARAPDDAPAVKNAPTLRWKDGAELSEAAQRWFVAALATEDGAGPPNAELRSVRAALEDEGCHALGAAILASFPENNASRWVRYQRALLGDDAAMSALGEQLGDDVYTDSAAFAAHGVEVLRRNPTPAAVRWLDHYACKSKGKLQKVAAQAIDSLVAERGLGRDDLVDLATPTTSDDASVAAIVGRLEAAMCTARRWDAGRWAAFFVDHPVVSEVTTGLLFATFEGDALGLTFRVVDGAPIGLDGGALELPSAAQIGIPHPVELDDELLEAWIEQLGEQPFEQLDRPFTRDAETVLRAALPAPPIETRELLGALERLGYQKGAPQDAGWIYDARRRVGASWTLSLSHDGVLASTGRSPNGSTSIVQELRVRGPEGAATPPALYSEALKDARAIIATLP